ncbi:hypothetical protein D3C71_1343420 [compost metagenome]
MFRYKVELVEPNVIIKNWTEYFSEDIVQYVEIPSQYITQSITSYIVRVTTQTYTEVNTITDTTIQMKNEPPVVEITMVGNEAIITINDEDLDYIRYNVSLNGTKVYPKDDTFTTLTRTPLSYSIQFRPEQINIDEENVLHVNSIDQYGATSSIESKFIGSRNSLVFCDENGEYYSNDINNLLNYLDFGTLVAGQTSLEAKVIMKNAYNYKVKNLQLSYGIDVNNVQIEFSKTTNPFIAEPNLSYNELEVNETIDFYMRLVADKTAKIGGIANIKVKAEQLIN